MKNTITATMVLMILVSAGCIGTEEKSNTTGMPNPAAVYCKNMGYEYRTATDADGSQRGECKVDGRWVDEWTLYRNASREDVETIGGDQDEHGCYLAAGYSWCNEKNKCVRPWEENCSDYTIAKTTGERCTQDADCTTPVEYLMLSHCPYTSKCIDGKCAVVCPFPFTASKPEISSYEECVAAGYDIMKSNPPQCMTADGMTFTEEESTGGGVGMANPAALYCQKMGYEYRIVTDADGSQRGECKTAEGVWVDEWALYNRGIDVTQPPEESGPAKECTDAGGHWNECGSKCMLDNQGNEGAACTMQCETLCECGGIAGFRCPAGYTCNMPTGIADAMGYCTPAQGGKGPECVSAGGHWNECGSTCGIDNQGKDVACPAICNQICECGGKAALRCPEGYACRTPPRITNASGYCVLVQGGGGAKMSLTEARKIAEGSDCAKKGTLTKKITYNNETGTWWFDLEMREEYRTADCNPACVVSEETKAAEINWRCTGLIPSPPKEAFCGTSTSGACTEDEDCTTGGCSGQVCQGRTEDPAVTDCMFRDCYQAGDYGLGCKCVDNRCQWAK